MILPGISSDGVAPVVPFVGTSLSGAHVMVVDDEAVNRILLGAVIETLGIGQITMAENGLRCLELLRSGVIPDLILLDIMMPELDGLEACRIIRTELGMTELPIVIQTALSDPEDRVNCFSVGATDVLAKPLFIPELRARLCTHLQNALMLRSLRQFQIKMNQDLGVAQGMQQRILPDRAKLTRALAPVGLIFDALYEPCDNIGGDIWHAELVDGRHVVLLTLDFVGHGLVAAINAFRVHSLISQLHSYALQPDLWLGALNKTIHDEFDGAVLATGFYGVFDRVTGILSYATAGVPAPLIGAPDDSGQMAVTALDSRGLMLGILANADYALLQGTVPSDGFLFLYSDGLEQQSDGTPIASETISAALLDQVAAGAPDLAALRTHLVGGHSNVDDITLIWLSHAPPPRPIRLVRDAEPGADPVEAFALETAPLDAALAGRPAGADLAEVIVTRAGLAGATGRIGQPGYFVATPGLSADWQRRLLDWAADPAVLGGFCLDCSSLLAGSPVSDMVDRLAAQGLLSALRVGDVALALTEALANALFHGSLAGVAPAEATPAHLARGVALIIRLQATTLSFTLRQELPLGGSCVRFWETDPAERAMPSPLEPGGRGLFIIAAMTDRVTLTPDGCGITMALDR